MMLLRGSFQAFNGVGLWEQSTLDHQSTMLPLNQEPHGERVHGVVSAQRDCPSGPTTITEHPSLT